MDMSEYNGGCPEFMSISLFNIFTLFPSLRLLKLQSVALQKDLSFKTLTDYVKENRELATLQLKNCKIIHEEFIEELKSSSSESFLSESLDSWPTLAETVLSTRSSALAKEPLTLRDRHQQNTTTA